MIERWRDGQIGMIEREIERDREIEMIYRERKGELERQRD